MNILTVGIDLGTDKCCITYQDKIGRPFIIIDNDSYKIPSMIGITENGLLIGNDISKNNSYDIPIITNIKRLIGHNSTSIYAQNIAKYNNWIIKDDINDDLIIIINDKEYSLNFLMCSLLYRLKRIIIDNIGENFNVIITIPANFNEGQKNKILYYCKQVNIECKYLVYEPCSAALTYINYFNNIDDEELKRIVVFDFGAGTLDLAIVSSNCIKNDNECEWMAKIECHIGDNNLGGIDIDILLNDYLLEKCPELKNIKEPLNFLIEQIKIKLSLKKNVIETYYGYFITINYEEYNKLLNDKLKGRIIKLLDELHNCYISKLDIDIILLIGGSCYNIWIKELIEEYYNKTINSFQLELTNKDKTYKLDIKDIGVSLGATCYNRKFNKGSNLILTEALPLSIGIETVDNIMCKLIPKNTLIPCLFKKYFTTFEDNQKQFEIKLYQGEEDDIRQNYFLGSFIIDNLEPEPQGKIVLVLTIYITTDGLITIEGKIKNTDKYNKKLIINRFDNFNNNIVCSGFEFNDTLYNNIMTKYYDVMTLLNKLEDKLINDKLVDKLLKPLWDDLNIIFVLMNKSEKYNKNINKMTKFMYNIVNKFGYEINNNIEDDEKFVLLKLNYILKNI